MAKSSKLSTFAPIIVLVAICLVASFLLAGVYQLTAPVIAEITEKTNSEARLAVLPEGNSFTQITDVDLVNGVNDVYKADNGAGIVCSTSFNGFGGAVKLMIGVSADGQVTGVQVLEQSETPGVGSNALTTSYLEQFNGQSDAAAVDFYSGATFTSKAVRNGVSAALAQYSAVKAAGEI